MIYLAGIITTFWIMLALAVSWIAERTPLRQIVVPFVSGWAVSLAYVWWMVVPS